MTSVRVVKVFFYESYINVYVLKEADTASLTNVEEILSNQITIFKDRVRIDVQTSTPCLRFQDAWKRR
jgi:hypothetical protein